MNYIYGKTSPSFECDKRKSLAAILCETMLKFPKDEISSVDANTKKEITHHQLLIEAIAIARHFQSLGVAKGNVVAFMVENTIHFGSYFLGALLLDAIFAPLNPAFTTYEFDQICKWLQPKILVCNQTNMETVKNVQNNHNFTNLEYSPPKVDYSTEKSLNLKDFDDFFSNDVNPNDPVLIICSSGTTGLPKGVVHSNLSVMNALDYLTDEELQSKNTDILLAYLPFYHLMGIIALLGNFYCGQKLIVMQKFKPQTFLAALQEYKVNKMYIVPTVALFLTQYDDLGNFDLSTLKEMICAGSMLSSATYDALREKLPNVCIRLAYGMSEINYTTITPPSTNDYNNGSVGKLVPGCVAKVIDIDTNEILPVYKTGELCIRSKSNFIGYYNNEKETINIFDADGFVHTGDIVYYNESGDIFIVDRIKELIKHKSFQVSPVELEAILLNHQAVADVAVIGVPDDKCGELPRAFVVLRNKSIATEAKTQLEQELQDFVAKHVSPYKKLSGGVHFVNEIPKNSSGKILRRQLKAKYLSEE